MKFIICFLILSLALTSIQAVDKRSSHFLKRKLPGTPKANHLSNHYGTHKFNNIYGPKLLPLVDVKRLLIKNEEGTYNKFPGLVPVEATACDIRKQAFYEVCANITTCDLCAAATVCGWCHSIKKCLPGTLASCGCSEACPKAWFYQAERCSSSLKSGELDNIAPDATTFITPNYTTPKINITTSILKTTVEQVPVQIGTSVERIDVTAHQKSENRVVSGKINVEKPVYAYFPQPAVGVTIETKVMDVNSGKEIKNDEKKTFGIDRN